MQSKVSLGMGFSWAPYFAQRASTELVRRLWAVGHGPGAAACAWQASSKAELMSFLFFLLGLDLSISATDFFELVYFLLFI